MELKSFYKSKDWEDFRRVIISERTAEDGFIYCNICGKPILKKYDLILHHKTELTDASVEDANIAFNPDNIECVHFACHNKEHGRFSAGTSGYKVAPKKVYIVYGAPCSGKSTWVRSVAGKNDLIVDLDSLWQAVSINARYVKPDRLKSVVFELRDKLYDLIKYRSGKWLNAFVITGGALHGDRERLQARVNADELIFIEATKEECIERSIERSDEWRGYIEEWFESYQK